MRSRSDDMTFVATLVAGNREGHSHHPFRPAIGNRFLYARGQAAGRCARFTR